MTIAFNGQSQVSGRASTVVLLVLALTAAMLLFLHENGTIEKLPEQKRPPVKVEIKDTTASPKQGWNVFVNSISKSCEGKQPPVSVAYNALHEYKGGYFGVLVIAWQESEYEVNLYRFDQHTTGWRPSSIMQSDGMGGVDVARTSSQWGVPKETIESWLKKAHDFMQNKK
ncbi:MAG TPA: hypothetical protein VGK34_07725 [Armatimonadota bacterium]